MIRVLRRETSANLRTSLIDETKEMKTMIHALPRLMTSRTPHFSSGDISVKFGRGNPGTLTYIISCTERTNKSAIQRLARLTQFLILESREKFLALPLRALTIKMSRNDVLVFFLFLVATLTAWVIATDVQ